MDALSTFHFPKGILTKGAIAQEAATGIQAVLAAMTTVTSLVGNVFDVITGNAVLVVFMAASLIGVGVHVFHLIKNAAR